MQFGDTTKRTEHFFCAFRKIAKGKARISFLWEQSLTAHTRRSTVANIRRSSNLCKQKGGLFPLCSSLAWLACMLYGRVADIMHFTKINWENSSDFAAVSYRRSRAGRTEALLFFRACEQNYDWAKILSIFMQCNIWSRKWCLFFQIVSKGHNRPWMRPYFLTFCTKGHRRRAEQFWPFSKGQSSLYNKAEQKGNCTTIHTVCCVPSWPITSHYWKAMRPSSVRLMIGIPMINQGLSHATLFCTHTQKERKGGIRVRKKAKSIAFFRS